MIVYFFSKRKKPPGTHATLHHININSKLAVYLCQKKSNSMDTTKVTQHMSWLIEIQLKWT